MIDLHAERYRIVCDTDYGYGIVHVYSGMGGPQTFVHRTLDSLRDRVAELRESGAVRDLRCTYRAILRAEADSGFYGLTLAKPWPHYADTTLPLHGSAIHQWGLPIDADNLADPLVRFLAVPYAGDTYGASERDVLLLDTNREALQELASESPYDDPFGWLGGSWALDIDTEADPDIWEAVAGLEDYPCVSDEALSLAETEADAEDWQQWARSEFLDEVASALFDDPDGFVFDVEPDTVADSILWGAATSFGPLSESNLAEAARRFIGDDPIGTLAELYSDRMLRFEGIPHDEPILDAIPPSPNVEATARAIVERLHGECDADDPDAQNIAKAIAKAYDNADRTGRLPFPESTQ